MEWNASLHPHPLRWSELERVLSGTFEGHLEPAHPGTSATPGTPPSRENGQPPASGYAELHAASTYHFFRGASEPEAMVAAAKAKGIEALALVDRDGMYGAMEFAEAAEAAGLPTIFGAELTLEAPLTALCKGPEGYRRLCHVLSDARMRGSKHTTVYPPLETIARELGGHCYVLAGHEWAGKLDRLACFAPNVLAELAVSLTPEDADHEDYANTSGYPVVVSMRPSAATLAEARLAGVKQALGKRQDLSTAQPGLHPAGGTWLRVPTEYREHFPRTLAVARECAFPLSLVAPQLPHWPRAMEELESLVWERFEQRYAKHPQVRARARQQARYELGVISQLGFPGYFLIVDDIMEMCRRSNILSQGRGSAANSVVCFVLGITNAEPVGSGLLFERFLSAERDGPPDIDIDIESGRREEVIQYVYARYGRDSAAQVANVITYRRKGALRDAARALGYAPGLADAWSTGRAAVPQQVEALATQLVGQPRHLGIHSGGMVVCDRPIADVVPVEWATMPGRSVVQWDKEGCARAGLVKFDLLGLGMLEALHHMIDLVEESTGERIKLWELDLEDPEVYSMLSSGDAVGVFQVESRAQLATLPRLKPRTFYDLVVQVALIRPGPIQGGSVHPYIRRRNGEEPVEYEHPLLERSLGKTLGVPLFQEQLMQMAVDVAGFSASEADQLRRAMGSKRSPVKMAAMRRRFYAGLARNGIRDALADQLWNKVTAFAAYGFPESHSQSFAALVYFSAWMKRYYPAQFCVGLLRAQPMGFYSPQSLLADARRHGVRVLPISVNASQVESSLEGDAIRLGLNLVRGLGEAVSIPANAPYSSVGDVARRAGLKKHKIEALAKAGALDAFGSRRQGLWQAGTVGAEGMLPDVAVAPPSLPGMSELELMAADIAATGVSHTPPMHLVREALDGEGVVRACELLGPPDGTRVSVAGVVTHRQRPQTAGGITFLGIEDETGLINVVVSRGLWQRCLPARAAKAVVVRGIVRNHSGVASITADRIEALALGEVMSRGARNFR